MQQTEELQNISEDRMHRMHVGLSFLQASILGDQALTQGLKGHTFITFRNSIKGTATSAGPNMVQSSSTSRNLGGPIWPSCNKFVMSGKLSAKQLAHRCSSKLCLLTAKLCCCQTRYWIDWWLLMAWFAWGVTSVLIDNQHVRTRTCNRPSSPRIQQFCGVTDARGFFRALRVWDFFKQFWQIQFPSK